MAERKRSSRTERRLRLNIARHLAEESLAQSTSTTALTELHSEDCKREIADTSTAAKRYCSSEDCQLKELEIECVPREGTGSTPRLRPSTSSPEPSVGSESFESLCDGETYQLEESDLNEESNLSDVSSDSDVNDSSDDLSDVSDAEKGESMLSLSLLPRALELERALYQGSPVAADEFIVGLMLLCQRHNLTYSCQNDILRLMSMMHPSPNRVPRSSHLLLKHFVNLKEECSIQHFCGTCLSPTPCANSSCSLSEPNAVFIQVPLVQQLKERMQGAVITVYVHVCVIHLYTYSVHVLCGGRNKSVGAFLFTMDPSYNALNL